MPWGKAAFLVVILAVYGTTTFLIARPYRCFPTDDLRSFSRLLEPLGGNPASETQYTGCNLFLQLFGKVYGMFAPVTCAALALVAAVCNTCTLAILLLVTCRLTRSWLAIVMTGLLFCTSAWPMTYAFMFFYAPLVAIFSTAAVGGLTAFWIAPRPHPAWWYLAAASTVICFLCCPAAAVVSFLCLLLLALCRLEAIRNLVAWLVGTIDRRPVTSLVVGASVLALLALCAVVLGIGAWFVTFQHEYLNGLLWNAVVSSQNAAKKFGAIPPPPLFCGLWVLWIYSRSMAAAFLLTSAITLGLYVHHEYRRRSVHEAPPVLKAMGLLGMLVWAHELIADFLPFTKLARESFLTFPTVCLFVSLTCYYVYVNLRHWPRHVFLIGVLALFGSASADGLHQVRAMRHARQDLPHFFHDSLPHVKRIIVFKEDPFAPYIARWLGDEWIFHTVELQKFDPLAARSSGDAIVLLGPTGERSGNSVMGTGAEQDFYFDPLPAVYAERLQGRCQAVHFYPYFPLFCLEEEVCQGLLYAGGIPSGDDPDKQLKVFYWPAAPGPAQR